MYLTRTLESFLASATSQFPALFVTGARQVGKTSLLRHASGPDRIYVTLDDPLVMSLAKSDPALFLQRFPPPVLIDEIQYAPELLPYIKIAVDERKQPGLFWLTGSQQFHLMKGVSESLAGRVAVLRLLGLSRREILGKGGDAPPFHTTTTPRDCSPLGLKELYRLIWRGSFPAIALDDAMDRELFYGSYLQTYLQRDIRDLARVGDEMAFLRLVRAAAARTGQLLNMAELGRDADIALNTAKSWLSIMQASGLIFLLEPYHTNLTKRLVKTPKLYFLDTGLCSYLTQWSGPETLEAGAMAGPILETWVVGEILKSYWHNGRQAPLYFYRDKDKKEIDLLIMQDGSVTPLECKKSSSPGVRDIRHFQVLSNVHLPIGSGGVICLAERSLPLDATHRSIPIGEL
ncbi:MAG: ATPase [Desulfobulbaceae bacterium A2]|nr:MAG: ATPase [Desulfobulbaceae bacterium A2]